MPASLKVVDASALGALLFGEPRAAEVAERLERCELAAPTLLRYEIASIGLKKLRRYPRQRRALLEALELFEQLSLRELPLPTEEIVKLARRRRLTVYDAAYLWLARSLDAELVTLAVRLGRAVR